MTNTYYWHDYETWGANPVIDRASQFAGVRTDSDFNIIDEPLVMYCQPPEDIWPHADACLVTGITPQQAKDKGLCEREFISAIHRELSQPGTCGVGYNSLRFDDEVTRYGLYRNFFDPYEREWKHGNSRWDIIDMVRLVYALRPEGIEWPMVEDRVSFKLENLTQANGISHQSAHDAYSDVAATIEMAKLVRNKQPALFDYVQKYRSKRAAAALIDIAACKPLLHISSMYPASRGCAGLIAPLAMHPVNKNAVIIFDLSADPSELAQLTVEEIRQRVFSSQEQLGDKPRLPVKLVHLNKCPILATTKLLEPQIAERLGIDREQCERHWQTLRQMKVADKLRAMYQQDSFVPSPDPESRLYDGFMGDEDKKLMRELRSLDGESLAQTNFVFHDQRLNDMLLRYRARNFKTSLHGAERAEWMDFVCERLERGDDLAQSFEALGTRIVELQQIHAGDADKQELLNQLEQYRHSHMRQVVSECRDLAAG